MWCLQPGEVCEQREQPELQQLGRDDERLDGNRDRGRKPCSSSQLWLQREVQGAWENNTDLGFNFEQIFHSDTFGYFTSGNPELPIPWDVLLSDTGSSNLINQMLSSKVVKLHNFIITQKESLRIEHQRRWTLKKVFKFFSWRNWLWILHCILNIHFQSEECSIFNLARQCSLMMSSCSGQNDLNSCK